MPKPASEEVFGCLGNANFPMFQSSLNDYSTYSYGVTGERLVVCNVNTGEVPFKGHDSRFIEASSAALYGSRKAIAILMWRLP